jgi:hypothetical protein
VLGIHAGLGFQATLFITLSGIVRARKFSEGRKSVSNPEVAMVFDPMTFVVVAGRCEEQPSRLTGEGALYITLRLFSKGATLHFFFNLGCVSTDCIKGASLQRAYRRKRKIDNSFEKHKEFGM